MFPLFLVPRSVWCARRWRSASLTPLSALWGTWLLRTSSSGRVTGCACATVVSSAHGGVGRVQSRPVHDLGEEGRSPTRWCSRDHAVSAHRRDARPCRVFSCFSTAICSSSRPTSIAITRRWSTRRWRWPTLAAARADPGRRRWPGVARGAGASARRSGHAGRSRSGDDLAVQAVPRCWPLNRHVVLRSAASRWSTTTRWSGSRAPAGTWDAAIIDFPDPNTFSLGKLYTKLFYRLLAAAVAGRRGQRAVYVAAVRAAPRTGASCRQSEAAGFAVQPYHVAVPSFGVWGFALARQQTFEPPTHRRPDCASSTTA